MMMTCRPNTSNLASYQEEVVLSHEIYTNSEGYYQCEAQRIDNVIEEIGAGKVKCKYQQVTKQSPQGRNQDDHKTTIDRIFLQLARRSLDL